MEETEAHGLRLIAQLRRESEQVHIPRWKLFSGPLVLTPVLLVTILLFFWDFKYAIVAVAIVAGLEIYVWRRAKESEHRWQRLDRINFTQFDNVSGGDVVVESEIFGAYLSSWDQTMGSLQKAVKELNPHDAKLYSHSMKGACLSIGFTRLSEIFKEMERLSLEQQFGEIRKLLPMACEEHENVKLGMKEYFSFRAANASH